jgi:hypothetical protein
MNRIEGQFNPLTWFLALLLAVFLAGCGGGGGGSVSTGTTAGATVLPGAAGSAGAATADPTVGSANPANGATNVATSTNGPGNVLSGTLLTATFTQAMNPATVTALGTFTLKQTIAGTDVPGTVTMDATNTIATFKPTAAALLPGTQYTATVSTAAKNAGGTAMPSSVAWSFTTNATVRTGQAPVNLLSAGNFVILAKTAITDVPASAITGNIGVSPTSGTAIGVLCTEMVGTGKIFAVDAGYALPGFAACSMPGPGANKTLVDNAVLDMGTARAEAAGRTNPDATELGAGVIGGLNLAPGLYKWSTNVSIPTDVTLTGGASDVWVFQIAGDLSIAAGGSVPAGIKVILAGGAKASNVFWQVGGPTGATLGTFSTFNGIILSAKQVIVNTGAVVNGRLYADSQVTLQQNPVTQPAP